MTLLKVLGVALGVMFIFAIVKGLVARFRSPPYVREAHRRLRRVVKESNRRQLTDEERVIIEDAERVGMVRTSLTSRRNSFYLKYRLSEFAYEMALEGRYPTSDQVDEELKAFEVPRMQA
ncbi:MAG TPA: hypothetical protein VFY28_01605 [Candidatus Paceibacterota bacterium]|nr:hypothetical protein [Candidatus Paceibacterota bacterium]